jgi:hypothetical protein
MAELDLPIWLHPVGTAAMPDHPAEKKSRFEMWWCFHWPYETSVAMVRMVFSGLLDRYPKLKIITHHLGGMIPYYDGRVGPGLKVLGQRTSDEDYSKILPSLKRPHMAYLHDFYADNAMFGGGVLATRCGHEFLARSTWFLPPMPRWPDSADHQNSGRAKPAGGRATRDLLRQRGAAAEYEIQLTNPGLFFLLSFDVRRAGDPGKTGWVAGRKTVIGTRRHLVFVALGPLALGLDPFAHRLIAMVVPRMPGFAHRIGHFQSPLPAEAN